jgi:hypothetical protein
LTSGEVLPGAFIAGEADDHELAGPAGIADDSDYESMTGPLLTLFYPSSKLAQGLAAWLTAIKKAAERR